MANYLPIFSRCNVCGKEFYEKALYRRHVKKATHGKKGRAKQNLERTCEHCGRKFTQLREYRRHMNNHEGKCDNLNFDSDPLKKTSKKWFRN